MNNKILIKIFNDFVEKYNIDTNYNLFDIDENLNVNTILYKKTKSVLKRSSSMKKQLITEVNKTIKDYNDIGLWNEFGKTSLTFLEYQMIGVCSKLFPNDLVNFEGVNR